MKNSVPGIPVEVEADPIIFQSAQFGEPRPGYALEPSQFIGVRFEISAPVVSSTIGGAFLSQTSSTGSTSDSELFGAIVRLSGPTDFPDTFALSSPDVLGTTRIIVPVDTPVQDRSAPLTLALVPGWYALMFGSDQIGPRGVGGISVGHIPLNSPSFFFITPPERTMSNMQDQDMRVFVTGSDTVQPVPEPASVLLVGGGVLGLILTCRRRRAFLVARW
jgi:hypothetical protein